MPANKSQGASYRQTQASDPVQEQKIYKIRKVVASGPGSVWFLMEHKLDTMLGFFTGSHTSSHGNITLKFFLCSLHMARIVILKDKSSAVESRGMQRVYYYREGKGRDSKP
ncbi:hypothetical protein NC652_010121 [Populus alba x Populus x berolinensis]|uniref:Uncharacterized protein n=1 Tax=Populus alba x Populus x berolinensis TaxID=444605 RepID=A0AAD6QZ46_9ROSI|nr:hypothetical protein NC652_010121 [Populus alba x Populus x berolinensis]KAJ6999370.1 hypothetical protein NC653_010154 [Populus alba x Populus x berolinensis]